VARGLSEVEVPVGGSVMMWVAEMKGTEVVTPSIVVNWPSDADVGSITLDNCSDCRVERSGV
jgi:hypothetical protein